jgi:hypothetical protein
VHEIVRFARPEGTLCQGSGSAANSTCCYVLGITPVNLSKHDLLFECFVWTRRTEPRDNDVDFKHERREEVIRHIYERDGRERGGDRRHRDPLPPPLGGVQGGRGAGAVGGRHRQTFQRPLSTVLEIMWDAPR